MEEFAAIKKIRTLLGPPSDRVEVGIGDDAAVLKAVGKRLLVCSDAMVEKVHFDLSYASPEDVGYKAVAACLSDIAAMNGTPICALISLALPKSKNDYFIEGFYKGASEIAKLCKCDIVGGDLTFSPSGIFIDVTCVGEAQTPIGRNGAKPGDLIAVSGTPGKSAAGLSVLQRTLSFQQNKKWQSLIKAHLRPMPRFDLLATLGVTANLCTSMIDLSDGLSSELHHLAESSGHGFEIDLAAIPIGPLVRELAAEITADKASDPALAWALSGGEDYELLVTLDPCKHARLLVDLPAKDLPGLTVIGRVTAEVGVRICTDGTEWHSLPPTGYQHFSDS